MRGWRTRLALVLLGALGLTGCGGGGSSGSGSSAGGVTAAVYVRAVCSALGPFERDIQSRSSALNVSRIESAPRAKAAVVGFLEAITADTQKVVAELKSAGSPEVAGGSRIATAIIGAFDNLDVALSRASARGRSLPTGSAAAFRNAALALGTEVRGSMGSIGAGLSALRNAQFEAAARKEPACAVIG